MKKQRIKKALVSSALALLLCVSMFIGNTFAWFTDTASTSVNTIKAGKLKIDLLDADGNSLDGKSLSWQKAASHENEAVLWEPGCTYSLQPITVKNVGNLALKYKVVITGIDGDAELNDVIDWTVEVDKGGSTKETYELGKEFHLTADQYHTLTISGHMQETAGNDYQGKSIDNIAITVYATQYTYEYDSTTNQYDAGATYDIPWDGKTTTAPTKDADNVYHITSAEELAYAMQASQSNSGSEQQAYASGSYVLENDIDLGGATINGFGDESAAFTGRFNGQGHTISNFVIGRSDKEDYAGLFNYVTGTISNLTVKDATVNGICKVGALAGGVYGTVANCTVEDCIINANRKVGGAIGYAQTATVSNVTVKDTDVYCGVTEQDIYGKDQWGEVIGYKNTGLTETGNKSENVNVYRGVTVVTSAAELTAAVAKNTANVSVLLLNDITMPDNWTSIDIGFYGDYKNVINLTINGNGHTISGLTSALVEKISANCSLTISNLTVKDAKISNSSYTNGMGNGVLLGYVENGSVTLNNCHVVDSEITESSVAAAALIGYISNGTKIEITNCTVENTTVKGDSAAGFVGYAQQTEITVSGCKVSGGSFTGEATNKQGAYFGTVNVDTTADISNTTADTTDLVGRILSNGAVNYN